jgi:hypothetical protein
MRLAALVTRPLMLLAWCLVFWGTLVVGAFLVKAATGSLREAVESVEPGRSADAWAWANVSAAGLACVVWTIVVVTLVRRRRDRAT